MNRKYATAIGIVIVLALIAAAYFTFSKGVNPYANQIDNQPTSLNAEGRTYISTAFGYEITYPSSWVGHTSPFAAPPGPTRETPDSAAERIILGPLTLPADCTIVAPPSPAIPIDIRVEDRDLNQLRTEYRSRVGGQDYVESTINLAGKTAYLYMSESDPEGICPEGGTQAFRVFLFEHRGEALSLTTHLYNDPVVREVIDSLRFVL